MSIKLSICIPTYNRAAFLSNALDSIIAQATDEVEIVVSDNASTDNTEALINEYQQRFPRIRYHRNSENLGADRNFLKVVELAQGEYCWLLGSDDALAKDAVMTMLPRLGNCDIYLVDRANLNFTMDQVLEPQQKMHGAARGAIYNCEDPKQRLTYFKDALHLGSLFSYISVLIIRRTTWQSYPDLEDLIGSAWIHAARIFQMMHGGAKLEYVGLPLVFNRTGNDSFHATVGYTSRRLIDLDYPRVARAVFSDQPDVLRQVTLIVADQFFNLRVMLSDKRAAIEADGPQAAQKLAAVYHSKFAKLPSYWLKMMLWYALPYSVLKALRTIWKRYHVWLCTGIEALWSARSKQGSSFNIVLNQGTNFRVYYSTRNGVYLDAHCKKHDKIIFIMNGIVYLSILMILAIVNGKKSASLPDTRSYSRWLGRTPRNASRFSASIKELLCVFGYYKK